MRRCLIGLLVLTILQLSCVASTFSGDVSSDQLKSRNQFGIRLGVWSNRGDSPDTSGLLISENEGTYRTNIKESAFYFEGSYVHYFTSHLMAEFSLGSVNRGSVTLKDENGATDIGHLILYPALVQLRIYPMLLPEMRLQPYITAGGGIYIGRQTVQFTNSSSYYSNWEEESGTDFNYVLGAGMDYPLGGSIGLDFAVKYMPIEFSKSLVTVEDYQAVTFTFGVKYLYRP